MVGNDGDDGNDGNDGDDGNDGNDGSDGNVPALYSHVFVPLFLAVCSLYSIPWIPFRMFLPVCSCPYMFLPSFLRAGYMFLHVPKGCVDRQGAKSGGGG